jgi:hypothetical protein
VSLRHDADCSPPAARPARAIWALYDDVSTWPLWDDQAEVGPMITADFPKTIGALIALAARDNQAPKQGA